jgi:hypothetical protein
VYWLVASLVNEKEIEEAVVTMDDGRLKPDE